MAHVFVSYAREDQAFVRRLHEALRARGRETWVDWEGIPPTARWWEEVQRAIEGGDAFLFVISPDSVASDVCRREAEHAFANQKRIVPLLHRDVADGEAPEPIGAHNWLFLRDGDELEAGVDAIVAALDLDVEWVRSHTRLLVRAKEWHEHGRDRSFVLRGSDLAEAERWLTRETATREPEPTQLHTQYILDSRAAATRAQRRRFGVSIGAVVVAVALAAAALVQRSTAVRERETAERQARIAQSRELAQSAEAQLATDPSLALLLAVEAAQRWHTVEAEQALRRAASASHERRILRGHEGGALSVTFSPDGESLLTTDGAGTARIWEPATGERLHELRGHVGPAGAAFSGDGGRVITWGDDGAAAVWDAATGERISTLGGPGSPLFRAGLGPDGSVALTAGEDGAARLWDADTGALRHEIRGHGGAPVGARLSPDGLLVVTHGDDERARLWDAATGDPLRTLTGFEGPVVDAAFSPDGALVVLGSPARANDDDADDVAIVFDARTGRRVTRVEPFGDPVQFVGFAKDGRHFLTAGPDGTKVWDLAELEDAFSGPLSPVSASSGAASLDAEFAPDGRSVATVDEEGRADLWSAFTGGLRLLAFRGHVGSVRSVSFDPSGGRVATAGEDGTVRIWDADPGAARTVLDLPEEEIVTGLDRASRDRLLSIGGEEVPVGDRLLSGYGAIRLWDDDGRRIAEVRRPGGSMGGFFTGDGRTILAANLSGRVFVLDGRTGAVRAEHASGAEPIVNTIDASPDGTRVVIPSADGTVRVVDVRSGEVTELIGHDGPVEFAEWSGDGARILSGAEDGTVIVWDAPSGRPERTLRHGAPLRQGAISADGARVASSGADATVRLWDVASGDELAVIRGFDEFAAPDVQLSPDGSVLLTDSDTVQLWDADSGRPRLELEPSDAGFGAPIPTAARFSPNGRWVAVADADGIVRIWDAESGAVTATLWGHQGFIHALHFGESGIVLSSGSRDRTARRFVCETCVGFPALLERARAARSRPLTDAECRQFLHAPCPGR